MRADWTACCRCSKKNHDETGAATGMPRTTMRKGDRCQPKPTQPGSSSCSRRRSRRCTAPPIPPPAQLTLLSNRRAVADAQTVYRLGDAHVLKVSPSAFPDASAEEVERMHVLKQRLGEPAGRVVLDVLGQGRVQGRSFFIVPHCRPLATGRIRWRLARWGVRGELLGWLREVCLVADAPDADTQAEFLTSLAALEQLDALPHDLREAARHMAQRLHAGTLQARHVPMHGDLWTANMMRQRDGRLALIDWGGATPRGYAIYGLIRAADSLGIPRRTLARELRWHGERLGDAREAPMLHLLGALGHYARHLGEFPLERFVQMAQRCHHMLRAAQ